ncbi:hypothetical protein [Calidifontibacillus erzurumensis]|uniref:Uncharacterized protein n=1 Tax=Calidifontibacillus erzurumensis TaxID=2741433 RepID=A0A8J8K8A9_9BACI|nr:hypothetical protein [Calidifontibacillus erzurumensis]NSL51711.1 hypothetical protein [Calidifontibacillus erzurumensis]
MLRDFHVMICSPGLLYPSGDKKQIARVTYEGKTVEYKFGVWVSVERIIDLISQTLLDRDFPQRKKKKQRLLEKMIRELEE